MCTAVKEMNIEVILIVMNTTGLGCSKLGQDNPGLV